MVLYAVRELALRGKKREMSRAWTIPLGVFSGAMSGAFNLGGVPSAAYAYSHSWSQGQIMAFLQVMLMLSCALRIFFYRTSGLVAGISWWETLLLMAPVYVAIWLGHLALRRSEPQAIRKGIFIFIAVSGLYYLLHRHAGA
jgi:hypothetical protein